MKHLENTIAADSAGWQGCILLTVISSLPPLLPHKWPTLLVLSTTASVLLPAAAPAAGRAHNMTMERITAAAKRQSDGNVNGRLMARRGNSCCSGGGGTGQRARRSAAAARTRDDEQPGPKGGADGELLIHRAAAGHRRNLCEQVWRACSSGGQTTCKASFRRAGGQAGMLTHRRGPRSPPLAATGAAAHPKQRQTAWRPPRRALAASSAQGTAGR